MGGRIEPRDSANVRCVLVARNSVTSQFLRALTPGPLDSEVTKALKLSDGHIDDNLRIDIATIGLARQRQPPSSFGIRWRKARGMAESMSRMRRYTRYAKSQARGHDDEVSQSITPTIAGDDVVRQPVVVADDLGHGTEPARPRHPLRSLPLRRASGEAFGRLGQQLVGHAEDRSGKAVGRVDLTSCQCGKRLVAGLHRHRSPHSTASVRLIVPFPIRVNWRAVRSRNSGVPAPQRRRAVEFVTRAASGSGAALSRSRHEPRRAAAPRGRIRDTSRVGGRRRLAVEFVTRAASAGGRPRG